MEENNQNPLNPDNDTPRFGEKAPEGWTWDGNAQETQKDGQSGHTITPPAFKAPESVDASKNLTVPVKRTWNTVLSIVFMTICTIVSFLLIFFALTAVTSFNLQFEIAKLGKFTPPAGHESVTLFTVLAVALIWVTALVLTIWGLKKGRIVFWIPLVAGIITFFIYIYLGAFYLPSLEELYKYLGTHPDFFWKMVK